MAKYSSFLRDSNGAIRAGKTVSVYQNGALATLTSDLGVSIANPVTTRGDGYYEFNCANGIYDLIPQDGSIQRGLMIGLPMCTAGQRAVNTLRVAADVVGGEKVTVGVDVMEIEILTTDSTDVTAGGSFNQATGPITVLAATYPHLLTALGTLILVESEVMRLVATGTSLTYSRGQSGTTAAAHANATAIYIGDGIAAGSTIAVGMGGTLTPTDFTPALVADFNALGVSPITMTAISVNEILLTADDIGVLATACTETLAGSGNAFNAATMYGGKAQAFTNYSVQQRVPLAQEVTLAHMQFSFGFTPAFVTVRVCATATPAKDKLWDGGITISGGLVTLDEAGSVDWATTDTVTVTAVG